MNERGSIAAGRQIDAVVIGGSAGGLDAMLRILSGLPGTFRLPLIALLHLPNNNAASPVEGTRTTTTAVSTT